MTTYTLRPVSASLYQITTGRTKVGTVTKQADGTFRAKLGDRIEIASTAKGAFQKVAVPALGYSSPAELAQHNAAVRRQKAAFRAEVNHAMNQATQGRDFSSIFNLINKL